MIHTLSIYVVFLATTFFALLTASTYCASTTKINHRQHSRSRRVVANGYDVTDPDSYPYFARIDFDGEQGCGGSLIHPEFVLSAAHCFLYPDEEVAVFFKTIFYDDFSSEKQAIVKKVIIHENWDEETQLNDVALIQIEPVDFVSPVSMNRDRSLPVPGEPAVVVGYGEVEPDLFAYVLQEAELFITSDEKCNEEHQRTGGTDAVSMICALDATESQDACVGDSGGPLILLGATPDQDVVVGVVSSGDGECGQNTKGGVYSEVAFFADWVQATICKNAIVTPKDCDATAPLASKTYEVSPRDDNGSGAVNAASSASFISIIGTISILLLPLLVEL